MIKSRAFCPAHSFAKRVGGWSCKGENGCRAQIKCHLITKTQNRKSSLDFLGDVVLTQVGYRIYVTKRPLVTLNKSPRRKKVKVEKRKMKKTAPLVFEEGKEKLELFNDDALLEEGESNKSTEASSDMASEEEDILSPDFIDEEDSQPSTEEMASSDDKSMNDPSTGLQALHFSLQAVTGTLDSSGTQFSLGPSLGVRWQPQYLLSKNFSIGADIAWNSYSYEIANSTIGLTVIGYGAFAKYFFGKNIYGVLGYGVESWSTDNTNVDSSSFSRITYGGGYRFTKKFGGFLDSIELVGATLTGDIEGVNASHFKLSFNVSFY